MVHFLLEGIPSDDLTVGRDLKNGAMTNNTNNINADEINPTNCNVNKYISIIYMLCIIKPNYTTPI